MSYCQGCADWERKCLAAERLALDKIRKWFEDNVHGEVGKEGVIACDTLLEERRGRT